MLRRQTAQSFQNYLYDDLGRTRTLWDITIYGESVVQSHLIREANVCNGANLYLWNVLIRVNRVQIFCSKLN